MNFQTNILKIRENKHDICLPLIPKKVRLHGGMLTKAFHAIAGHTLDTFTALLNHSCDPNARLISEGAELRVRALKDISAGEELTISYGPDISDYSNPSDYEGRQRYLRANYGFDCTCRVCKLGQLGLTGQLQQRINEALAPNPGILASQIKTPLQRQDFLDKYTKELNACIAALEADGFPAGVYPTLALSRRKVACIILRLGGTKRTIPEIFKTLLHIYFYLEPLQIEPIDVYDRLAMLNNINILLNQVILGFFPLEGLSSEPRTFEQLICHLQAKYLVDIEKCYGKDSWVGVFEKQLFLSLMADRKRKMAARGIKWDYVALKDSADERTGFEKKMTELADWAGLGSWTLMDYLPDWQPSWSV